MCLSNSCECTELINYTQPVYVWREDPNSRQNTIKEIIDRATSDQDWPQVSGLFIHFEFELF